MSYEIDLGSWGSDLDDAAYGRALAALGVGLASVRRVVASDDALDRGADAAFLRTRLAGRPPTRWDIMPVLAAKLGDWAGWRLDIRPRRSPPPGPTPSASRAPVPCRVSLSSGSSTRSDGTPGWPTS